LERATNVRNMLGVQRSSYLVRENTGGPMVSDRMAHQRR